MLELEPQGPCPHFGLHMGGGFFIFEVVKPKMSPFKIQLLEQFLNQCSEECSLKAPGPSRPKPKLLSPSTQSS